MSVATARALGLRVAAALVVAVSAALAMATGAFAQGVTTGAVRGVVADESGQPVVGATVSLLAVWTGQQYRSTTQAAGRFFVANVQVGPYRVEARAIGFRPVRQEVLLSLGQIADVSLRMQAAPVELEAISVTGERGNPLISPDRTGPASSVSDSLISRLPSLNRNFTDFIQTAPSVVAVGEGRFTVAGQHNRANGIQIDGAINNDMFQLNSSNGLPGGRENARPISVEAIREFQVLVAPFDVRQGGFTGGLLNAITRSGTNRFSGSVYGYYQSQSFVGEDSVGGTVADFTRSEYGFTLGGPVIRDRLHFFASADVRTRNEPFVGLNIRSDTTGGNDSVGVGIRRATAERVQQIAIDSLGFDPGDWRAPTLQNPNQNAFLKLNWQVGPNSDVEASYNYVNASDDAFIRNPTATGSRDGYELSRSGYTNSGKTNSLRGRWNTAIGSRMTNELLVSYSSVRQPRDPVTRTTLIFVGGDRAGTNIAIGAERFSHDNNLDQDITEITDNLTLNLGRHVVTLGTHNELISIANDFFAASLGVWNFANPDSLARRVPNRYEIALPLKPGGPNVAFGAKQLGVYLQDQFQPNRRLTLTFGLRGDLPLLDWPDYNRALDSITAGASSPCVNPTGASPATCGGINTSLLPNRRTGASAVLAIRNWLWSPRVGFNYDVRGDGATYLRGGVGIFTGRPPYLFFSNAFGNTGASQATLTCSAAGSIPTFTVDPDNQPTACAVGGPPSPATPSIVYFDPRYRFPRNMRLSLGADHRLPWNMVGTVDLLFTKFLNQMYLTDVNLIQGGFAVGEAARPLYGTATTGSFTVRRRWSQFRDVIENRNTNEEYAVNLTFQLQKRFSDNLEFNGSYTWSRARDFMSYGSDIANSNLRFSPLDGTLDDRALTTSRFDIPHQVKVSGTANLPYGVQFSLLYVGRSGLPYTYTISGDANGDGLSGNDQVYVPVNMQDISLCPPSPAACTSTTPTSPSQYQLLEDFINSQPCLREQRGRIVERNSCRDPWRSFVNAKVAKVFRTFGGQGLELSADVFNALALLGLGGRVRETGSGFEANDMLSFVGYNGALGRARYRLALPTLNRVVSTSSRWRMLLGAKYTF